MDQKTDGHQRPTSAIFGRNMLIMNELETYSGSSGGNPVKVRVLSRAPSHFQWFTGSKPSPVDTPNYSMNEFAWIRDEYPDFIGGFF